MASNFVQVKSMVTTMKDGKLVDSGESIEFNLNKLQIVSITASAKYPDHALVRMANNITSIKGEDQNFLIVRESEESLVSRASFEIADPVVP